MRIIHISKKEKISVIRYVSLIVIFLLSICCSNKQNNLQSKALRIDSSSFNKSEVGQRPYFNHVVGHDEKDTIIGKFNGKTVDTLFVISKIVDKTEDNFYGTEKFYISSNNKNIPQIELYGIGSDPPKIVNEGDLDGNGTCEVGYLHTGENSQWRQYRIFTLVNGHWRYLVDNIIIKGDDEDCLITPEWFRASGVEIAEPGPKKGWVKINYATRSINAEIKDTIVRPTFSRIRD